MSYLYDNLKLALGGENVTKSKSTVISGWTPNNIRAIFISRDYIVVCNHLSLGSKVINLDRNLVSDDIQKIASSHYGSAKLNTLLSRRSLSCLEEIYIDLVFMSFPQVIDLVSYARDLVDSCSRLRYFGFADFSNCSSEYLKGVYLSKPIGYALAKDASREGVLKLEYKGTNNENWYRNYFLRPQYYKLDADKGNLAIHFRKIEDEYCKLQGIIEERNKDEVTGKLVLAMVSKDIENINTYFSRMEKKVLMKSEDEVRKLVQRALKVTISKYKSDGKGYQGLNINNLSKYIKNLTKDVEGALKYYELFSVMDRKADSLLDVNMMMSSLESGVGFFNVNDILDTICLNISLELKKTGYSDLVMMSVLMCESAIPDGNFSKSVLKSPNGGEGDIQGYFDFISEVIGMEV